MSMTIKLVVLAVLGLGDALAAALVSMALIKRGQGRMVIPICAAVGLSYCIAAAVILLFVEGPP